LNHSAAAISCWEWIKETWQVVAEWFNLNVIQPVAQFFSNMWTSIKNFASNAWTSIKNTWAVVANWFNANIIFPVRTFFSNLFTAIGNFAQDAWNKIKSAFSNVATWFKGNVTDPIGNLFKGAINLVIDALNWVIRGLNKISINIPDWVPGIGGKTWGIHIQEIPKLARGGIVTSPTIAMIGEKGPEAVVPLENTGFVDAIASAVGSAVLSAIQVTQSNSSEEREVILSIDGVKLARVMLPKLNSQAQRMGYRTILQTGGSAAW